MSHTVEGKPPSAAENPSAGNSNFLNVNILTEDADQPILTNDDVISEGEHNRPTME